MNKITKSPPPPPPPPSPTTGHTRTELLAGQFRSAAIYRPWFFETVITNMTVGGRRLPLACVHFNTDKTIVDTGTTNLRLPRKVETPGLRASGGRAV